MDDARNETTSCISSKKMDDMRDGALCSVTSYEKRRKAFETMNDCKNKSLDGSVSFEGRVSDRKKFFETHIIEQQQRENALISPTLSSCKSRTTGHTTMEEPNGPMFIEERTDSESLFRNKSQRLESERIDSRSLFNDGSARMGPEPSIRGFQTKWEPKFDSGKDEDPLDLESTWYSSREQADPTRKTFHENKINSTDPIVGSTAVSQRRNYIEQAESLDLKIISMLNGNDTDTEEKGREESEMDTRQGNGDGGIARSLEGNKNSDELESIKNQSNYPVVKIQVTSTISEDQSISKNDQNEEIPPTIAEGKIDINEMITEFQQASAKLSDKLMTSSSLKDETNSYDSSLAPNTLTVNELNELAERHHVSNSKEQNNGNNYICPSESTDYSIDSKGNSKATKTLSSKSAKSLKKSKGKGNGGMGKILNKAKKGMGKSVKNLTSIVKNTRKTKPTKQSLTGTQQSLEAINGISDQKNCLEFSDYFDEILAVELVNNSKGETGILKASQYLDSGKRLLRNGAELKKLDDLRASKELIRKARTYVYVGRQLAKQYLLAYRQELLERIGSNPVNDDAFAAFEDFFLSFLQCVGPCPGADTVEKSIFQVDEALRILSKLSEEEAIVVKSCVSKEINEETGVNRKVKVQGPIADVRNSADRDDIRRMKYTDHDRSLVIRRFVSDLRSFYEIDTNMKLSKIFLKRNQDKKDDEAKNLLNESLPYNYSEPLKFDNGRSFHTRSFTTVGSMKQEQPSSSLSTRRGRKSKEESLTEGIRPGTTVVSISIKNKQFKNKNKSTNNRKKKPLPTKWLPVGGRKQK
jgi:hypothetical protein